MPDNNTTPTTETRITLCNTDITIRQPSKGTPTMKWGTTRYCHPIMVIVSNEPPATFKYYGSASDYSEHKDILSETDLIFALECIISDAISGTYDCAEFFNEFRYEDPCEGFKAWQGCIKSLYMLNETGISEEMLYDMDNELSEMEHLQGDD